MRQNQPGPAPVAVVQRWDMAGVPRREVDDYVAALGREASMPIDARTVHGRLPVHYTHMRREFATVTITDTEHDNFSCGRTPLLARDDTVPQLVLTFPSSGVRFEQRERQVVAGERSLVGYWSTAPWRNQVLRMARARSLTVPLAELGVSDRMLGELLGRDIGSSPLGALMARHVVELVDLPELEVDTAHALGRPTLDLLRALFSLAAGDERGAQGPLAQTLGTRVMLHLRAHVQNPALSADSVAARFGISKRYLYVVLASSGVTFGDWVRTERLRRAAEALRARTSEELSIAAVARSVGFVDHSSFSRAFRERFGCTPSEWRRRAS